MCNKAFVHTIFSVCSNLMVACLLMTLNLQTTQCMANTYFDVQNWFLTESCHSFGQKIFEQSSSMTISVLFWNAVPHFIIIKDFYVKRFWQKAWHWLCCKSYLNILNYTTKCLDFQMLKIFGFYFCLVIEQRNNKSSFKGKLNFDVTF